MKQFHDILENRHEYARQWKNRTGGKVIGYFEPYFPEELAYAAGVLPVRIMAKYEDDDTTDKLMYGNCYCTRTMFSQFLNGEYDYIDGIAHTEGCQWMFNAFQMISITYPEKFSHFMFVPDYPEARSSKSLMLSEMGILKKNLEAWTGNTITDEALDNAIEVYNRNRRLLKQVYELRKEDNSVILGSEAMEIAMTAQIMDKAEMNPMLEAALEELQARQPHRDMLRIMVVGSETYDTYLEELVESLGANVVVDELDNGTSYFWNEVVPQKDRMLSLANRYLEREHTALKDSNWRHRLEHIFRMYEAYQVDAVIIEKQIYCHPHGSDNYALWKFFRERSIPYMYFERDTTLPTRENALRVESFLNMVRPGATRLAGWNNPVVL